MSEQDADVIRWGLDHLLGDMSIFDCCSTATQQNTNGQDVEFVREDNVSEVHTAVENDEVIAHALEEELAQNWSGQPFKNIFSGYEGSPEVVNNMGPSNSCLSTGEKLYEEEVPLELTDDFSSPDGEVGKRLNHVVPVPHVPRINSEIPTVDEAISDHQRLVDRLHVYDLLELKVQGDGNCQFRALSDQFYRSPEHHQFVREQIVNQLKSHPDIYKGYVPMAYDDYLEKMSKYGEWGDHVTLQAAADTYGIKIFVLTSFKDTCYIEILPNVEKSKRVIFLSFWAEVHYNSIYAEGDLPALDTEAQ